MNDNQLMVEVADLLLRVSRDGMPHTEWIEELEELRAGQRGLLIDEETEQARTALLDAVGETLESLSL